MFQDSILYLISCNEDPNASPNRKKRNAYSVGLNDNCQGTVVRSAPNSVLATAHPLRG